MLDLRLENLEKYIGYVDKQLIEGIEKAAITERDTKANDIIHESWVIVRDFLSGNGYVNKIFLEYMKEDIIMSVYAAVVYKMIDPVERSVIIQKAANVLGGKNYENTVRKALDNAENSFVENLDSWNNWSECHNTYEWNYFKNIIKNNDKSHSNKIKVFDEYDFYVFLSARNNWLFNHKNRESGMMINDWYAGIGKIFDDLSRKQVPKEKTARDILNIFIVEQMFSVISITTMIESWMKMTYCDFYSLKRGEREKELFLISIMAGLPKSIIEKYIGRLISTYEIAQSEMWYKPLYNLVYQINYLKLYIYPLCKIMLYHTIKLKSKSIGEKKLITSIEAYINKYISDMKNLERLTYAYNWEVYYKMLSELRYPIEYNEKANSKGGNQKLIYSIRNNIPIESFGVNFTYFYFTQNEKRNVFEIRNALENEGTLTTDEQAAAYQIGRRSFDYNKYITISTNQVLTDLNNYEDYNTENYNRFTKSKRTNG
ncbi:MAG: hypothetical protein HFG76_01395 [Hungatella sp.]|nr:hypothetical protein [Hungatella sp.]